MLLCLEDNSSVLPLHVPYIHDPEILVFDEATSSLDSQSEQYIQKTIQGLRDKNKTIIIIAHRLSTVVHADEVMLLENGQIAESGTHHELFSLKGKYHALWQQQLAGFDR